MCYHNNVIIGGIMKVANKKIIVTGAGAGIGRELVLNLLNKNAYVIGLDINEKGLNETKKKVGKNKNFETYVVDVTSDESLNNFKEAYFKKHDTVDGLINNAGIIQPFINVNDLEMKMIDKVMNVNFYGPLKLTKMFLPTMLKQPEAHIVNVSSMGGFFPFPGQTIYGASKAALKLFTEGLYAELLETNVKVTIVFPGAIHTDIAKNSNVEMASRTSSKAYKMTEPDQAAEMIVSGMEANAFQLYVGPDSKMMNLMYKANPKWAINFIKNKMK